MNYFFTCVETFLGVTVESTFQSVLQLTYKYRKCD